jgi:AAA domain-containing protein
MSLPEAPVDNTELKSFFNLLYRDTEGYVYIAIKDPKLPVEHPEYWKKKFFKWPHQVEDLISYVTNSSRKYDVYSSPSLFRREDATKAAWLGTWCVWTEFDGNTPQLGSQTLDCPHPSIRIRSSLETHEHWYWQLREFCDSIEVFESASRRISYGLQADTSTWNCNRVLRPPNTIHQECGRQVAIVERLGTRHTLDEIATSFPSLDTRNATVETPQNIPDIGSVVAKYAWPDGVFKKFVGKVNPGKRSDSLCWIAHECAVMGMSNNEIMSVLLNADQRWGKFTGRIDRIEQLTSIIANTRQKHPENELPAIGIWDFVKQDVQLKWIIDNFLPDQALTCMVSPPGIGKTQFALQLAIHVALGLNFIGLRVNEPAKSTFVSLEMPAPQLHYFTHQMLARYPDKEKKILNEMLILVPLGVDLPLDKTYPQQELIRHVAKHDPRGIIIDSLGTSISASTSDEAAAKTVFNFIKENFISQEKFVWLIHHFRKGQVGNKQPSDLDDLHGSGVIGRLSDLVLSLKSRGDDELSVSSLKTRLSAPIKEFNIRRVAGLNFERVQAIRESADVSRTYKPNTGEISLADSI